MPEEVRSVESPHAFCVVDVAEMCHEANRSYCKLRNDHSQPPWLDAPQWQRDSAIDGVRAHMAGTLTSAQSHESWMKKKIEDGWVYGEAKDEDAKTHPDMIPYRDLPERERRKDVLFAAVVEAMTTTAL